MTDTLQQLAAESVPGYASMPARTYAETSDPSALGLTLMLAEEESRINTVGRVPPIVRTQLRPGQPNLLREEIPIFGATMAYERASGKLRAHTRFEHATVEGAVFRTDCMAIPELWWETTLTWDTLEDALKQRPSL